MRGQPEFGFPKFDIAAVQLRAAGYDVISPAEHDRDHGFDPAGLTGDEDLLGLGFSLRETLLWDLEQVMEVDGVALLDGWENSLGAKAEVALADAIGTESARVYSWLARADREPGVTETIKQDAPTVPDPWGAAREYAAELARDYDPFKRVSPLPTNWYMSNMTERHPLAKLEEKRSVSASGGKKGVKLARMDMIPTDALWELAEHYGKGAGKYETGDGGLDNWRLGYEWSKSFAAAMRHLTLALGGEDADPETGSKHVIAVAWHALALAHWMNNPEMHRYDDRQAVLEERSHVMMRPSNEGNTL